MAARKKSTKFIQKAIKRPGALTRKAKRAGKSTQAFAEEHKHDSGKTGEEARFDINVLRKASRNKKRGAKKTTKRKSTRKRKRSAARR